MNRPHHPFHLCTLLAVSPIVLLMISPITATEPPSNTIPLGLVPVQHPQENPPTAAKIALGKQLFFDPRLSNDKTVSCATCHDPAKGFSNGEAVATGVGQLKGGRNSPTVLNSAYHVTQFWDGRAASLEEQALGPIQNPIEMNMSMDLAIERLNAIPGYRAQFQKVFGTEVNEEGIAKAIAAYERTILAGDSPYDRYQAGQKEALTSEQKRGMDLFFGKAHCSACHTGPNLTDNAFHNIGIGMEKQQLDPGRVAISKLEGDTGSFKTPTLRDLLLSAPFMHDGSLKTVREVVVHYDQGGIDNPYLDEEIFRLNLTTQEIDDLVDFLENGLKSHAYPLHTAPELPQ